MIHFTTFFDKNYLSRGLVLYDSIKENCNNFELYVLCLDDYTQLYFKNNSIKYPEIKTLNIQELIENDYELEKCKTNRSTIEFYFTLSPCLPLYLIRKFNLPHICSLDADILFLNDLSIIFDFLNQYSIIATPHKFSNEFKYKADIYGHYNVSFQIFKSDQFGIGCLERWRKQCIEWCYDIEDIENKRFADQKYLDDWPILYNKNFKGLEDDSTGLASWNLNKYKIKEENNIFYSNGKRIIFYHFDAFKFLSKRIATNGFGETKIMKQKASDKLYIHYWKKIEVYNKILSFKEDQSTRRASSKNVILKLLNETSFYLKITDNKIIKLSYSFVPKKLKHYTYKILTKVLNLK